MPNCAYHPQLAILSVSSLLGCNYLGDSKSQMALKLHYWFKSFDNFAEWVDFPLWWSFSGGGSAMTIRHLIGLALLSGSDIKR